MNNYCCPICKKEVDFNPRYPKYVCKDCFSKATDIHGKKLTFFNTSISGGFEAVYKDSNEEYKSNICYINGIKCKAVESRFGGIIIEVE